MRLRLHRAVGERDGRDVGRVGLVRLGQVGGVGVDGEPLLGEPGDRAAGVEAAGEGDPERGALRGKRLVDAAHGLATYHRSHRSAQPRTRLRRAGRPRRRRADGPRPPPLPLGAPPRRRSGAPASTRVRCGWTAPSRPPGSGSAPGSGSPGSAPRGTSRRSRSARRCSSRTSTCSPSRSPAGSPPCPGGGLFHESTLLAVVRRRDPDAVPVHRLGRDTSGVVLFARTQRLARYALQRGAAGPEGPQGLPGALRGPPGAGRLRRRRPHRRGPLPAHRDAPRGGAGRPPLAEPGPRAGARGAATSRPRSSRWRSRPAGRTRSASTSPSPATRSWAIPLYGPGGLPFPGGTAVPGRPGLPPPRAADRVRAPATGAPVAVECTPPPALRTARSVAEHRRHPVGAPEDLERHLARPEAGGDGHAPEDEHGADAEDGQRPRVRSASSGSRPGRRGRCPPPRRRGSRCTRATAPRRGAWTGMSTGQARVQAPQSVQVGRCRARCAAARAKLASPSSAPYGQPQRHQAFFTTSERSTSPRRTPGRGGREVEEEEQHLRVGRHVVGGPQEAVERPRAASARGWPRRRRRGAGTSPR